LKRASLRIQTRNLHFDDFVQQKAECISKNELLNEFSCQQINWDCAGFFCSNRFEPNLGENDG